jgi:hypothetical protein
MRPALFGLVAISVVLAAPAAGLAQTQQPAPRLIVDVAFLGTAKSLARAREFTSKSVIFAELATKHADYPAPSLANWFPIDVSAGFRLWRSLGVSVTYSRLVYEDAASLDATIPHPTFLNAAGTGNGSTGVTLTRTESAIHLSLTGVVHDGRRLHVRLYGGPSFLRYSAEMVSDVLFDQTFDPVSPANTVTVTGFSNVQAHAGALGLHAGADFAHALRPRLDLVGTIRCTWGTATLDREPMSALEQRIRVGGVQAFAGLRVHVSK